MRYSIFLVGAVLAGCAQEPQPRGPISAFETLGNLQSTLPLDCVGIEVVTNQHTPADLYPGIEQCIASSDYPRAVQLYALAGVYGRFDMSRVSDPSALQAIQALQMNTFGPLSKVQNDAFKAEMGRYREPHSTALSGLCSKIKSVGAPDYRPTYMIEHGMGAAHGSTDNGLKSSFDPAQGWRDALSGYLHCE